MKYYKTVKFALCKVKFTVWPCNFLCYFLEMRCVMFHLELKKLHIIFHMKESFESGGNFCYS